MDDFFLPDDYKVPGESRYMRLQTGENRIRILSRPVIGWEDWKNKRPLRFRMTEKPQAPIDQSKPIRHFWAFVVWNYAASKMQILEITQVSIQRSIEMLARDPDWGNPSGYDIKIGKSGAGMETEYSVAPVPHKPLSIEIENEWVRVGGEICLEKLFDGGDPLDGCPF